MRKVWVVAAREYLAAVRSKAFLITLVMMPILMAGSLVIQALVHRLDSTQERRYAVVDRTPGGELAAFLRAAAEARNKAAIFDENDPAKQVRPKFRLEAVEPSAGDPESVARQRLGLSRRVLAGEFSGFLEVGPGVFEVGPAVDKARAYVRFQTNKPTQLDFPRWADRAVNAGVQMHRFRLAGLDPARIATLQQAVRLQPKGLTKQDPADPGKVVDETDEGRIANLAVPFALVMLMFMMIMIGATPAMQGVVEEKMQKVAEVLLGSVSPFRLMLGKLLGMVGVSLTVAAVYLLGIGVVASRYGVTDYLSPGLVAWFLAFLVLSVLMYGSLFLAIGAGASDMKETQSLLMPVLVLVMSPLFVLGPVIQDPNGLLGTAASFFPFATPMLMVARLSVPPGVPWWQPVAGAAVVLLATAACVWAAGRIFRVGILMQGKGAQLADLVRWAVRG